MPNVRVTNQYRVYPGETLTAANEAGITIVQGSDAPDAVLTVDGTVEVTLNPHPANGPFTVMGIAVDSPHSNGDAVVTIGVSGVLRVTSTASAGYGNTFGFWGGYSSPDLINHGLIEVRANGSAYGSLSYSSGGNNITNTGRITVVSSGATAYGVMMTDSGQFSNSGVIEVTGATGATAITLNGYYGNVFVNSGSIRAVDGGPASESVAVNFTPFAYSSTSSFTNSGWIEGDVALRAWRYSSYTATPPELFTNAGMLKGRVELSPNAERLVNVGTIWGDVTLGAGADTYEGATGTLIGRLAAGDGNDTLIGGAGADALAGDVGSDSVAGGSGGDTLAGGFDSDTITGGAGDDVISGGRDADLLEGGEGFDTLDFADATLGVSVDLALGRASAAGEDTVSGFEAARGGGFADSLNGGAAAERLEGGAGADVIWGRGGDDTLDGGSGANFLRGEDGDDWIIGGSDTDDAHGNMGNDTVQGGAGDDWVVGGRDQDLLFGEEGGDVVLGNLGDDTLEGGDGDDVVRGGQANDVVRGGAGSDWVSGDRGSDTLSGGAGADTFHLFDQAGIDNVTDFNAAEGDRINLLAGTVYSVAQEGDDVVIRTAGGAVMTLQDVQLATLPSGWIFGA